MALLLAVTLTGCNAPRSPLTATSQPAVGVQSPDRLIAAYADDLVTKRFQVIADFEDPRQGSLFHREPDHAPAAVAVTTVRAQQQSGVGSLKITLTGTSQRIVAADTPDSQWSLHQDWAPYHLLLFSVFSPREQGGFRFSIRSGGNTPLVYESPRIFLKTGWNPVRVDLGDLAEQVYLGDVREMRFWCDPLDSPIDLYLDDIILADNTRELLANAANTPGELSVKSQGRRLVVTSAERFELVFCRGQIRQWFDLVADPQRMHNLTGTGALGPVPVLLKAGNNGVPTEGPAQWSRLGPLAESYQSLAEVSPLRAVIHGEWRFGSADAPLGDTSPRHRWVYSVCRSGEVYVECSGSIKGAEVKEVGMLVGCDAASGFQRFISQPPAADARDQAAYILFSQPQRAGSADLLVVPAKAVPVQAIDKPADRRVCAVYRVPVEADQFSFAAMLRVWPGDVDTPRQAGPLALAYTRPLPIAVDAGSLVHTDPGDFDGDGYSEGRGYYLIQLDGRVAKLRLDGREHLRFSPAFKLMDVGDQDVWVYVDGRLVRNTQRDPNGNVLFEVPGAIAREILIEINASKREPAKAPAAK